MVMDRKILQLESLHARGSVGRIHMDMQRKTKKHDRSRAFPLLLVYSQILLASILPSQSRPPFTLNSWPSCISARSTIVSVPV